jgi:hypothetical protein
MYCPAVGSKTHPSQQTVEFWAINELKADLRRVPSMVNELARLA